MPLDADIYERRQPWGGPLTASLLFHGAILGLILAYGAWLGLSGNQWGGDSVGGGAMSVTLASAASIPLPRERQTDNIVASESKGVTKSEPKQAIPVPQPDAIEIPKTLKAPPKPVPHVSTEKKPQPVQQATNVVPFGGGGQVRQNFSTFNNALGMGALAITGGGDFGSRYAFYVRQVTQILSQNWLKYEVDPHTAGNASVSIAFDINRNGEPTNVRVLQSSGVPSLDISATRTLQRIDSFGPLPPDYRGSSVSAEYEFRYNPVRPR